jgi:hypothetical protein
MTTTRPNTTQQGGPVDPIGPDLTRILRTLKLGGFGVIPPERLAVVRQHKMATPRSSNSCSPTKSPVETPAWPCCAPSRRARPDDSTAYLGRA